MTDENNQHYDAMAASDFGFVYDGQMVSAANALHLPVNCMIKMRITSNGGTTFTIDGGVI